MQARHQLPEPAAYPDIDNSNATGMSQKIVPEENTLKPKVHALPLSGSFKKGTWKPHVSMLADVARMTDPHEMKERIKTSWSTMGIVSALILTMTYPGIVQPSYGAPPADPDEVYESIRHDMVMQTFTILNIISFILALAIDIIIVVLMTQLDLCCTPEHTRDFLITFAPLNEGLTGTFSMSIIILAAQVMAITWYNFSQTVNIATLAVWGLFMVIIAICSTLIAMFNRLQVAARGKAIMDEVASGAHMAVQGVQGVVQGITSAAHDLTH